MARLAPPLVTVVVPSFQHEGLIEECIRSVAAQTYGPLELVVVDDASRDGTPAVLERLLADAALVDRFEGRVVLELRSENAGAPDAINRGVALARGEWIAILNSDDRYHPERIAILLAAAQARGATFAFGGVRYVDRAGTDVTRSDPFAARLAGTQAAIRSRPSVGFSLLRENVTISTGNFLFHRDLAARVGPFRPLRYCHDWDFALRALLRTEPIYVDAPLYDYRLHETNSFRTLGEVAAADGFECLRAYFAAVRQSAFENWAAPGPATWPRVFERYLAEQGLEWLWNRTGGVRG